MAPTLRAQVERIGKQLDAFAADIHRAVSIEVFRRVIRRTPVHLVDGGQLRGNWQLTVGVQATAPVSQKRTQRQAEAAAKSAASRVPAYSTIFISNLLPYAGVVEYGGYPKSVKLGTWIPPRLRGRVGDDARVTKTAEVGKRKKKTVATHVQFSEGGFSRQAPKGMVRVSLQEVESAFAQIIQKAVDKANARR